MKSPSLPNQALEIARQLAKLDEPIYDEVHFLGEQQVDEESAAKSRLNYLRTLGILGKPKPVILGRAKGGTRLVQRDILSVLSFIDSHIQDYSLREIAGIIEQRRFDVLRDVFREFNVEEELPDPAKFKEIAVREVKQNCTFEEFLIRGKVLSLKVFEIDNILSKMHIEVDTVEGLKLNSEVEFCKKCGGELDRFLEKKINLMTGLVEIVMRDIAKAQGILEEAELGVI